MMAGINSKALNFGQPRNKRGFNGGNELQNTEFSDGSGLETYDAIHRMYDQQIGRFGQPDKLGDLSYDISLYAFASNNPISRNDPFGLTDTAVNQSHPKVLLAVTVTASNNRYKTFIWYGWSSTIDTHWKGNLDQFTYRMRAGDDILQEGDRYSYIDDVLNGNLLEQYLRDEEAREFERGFIHDLFYRSNTPW
jgi:RHS repeat-associated protein